jgi:hypothetical protein
MIQEQKFDYNLPNSTWQLVVNTEGVHFYDFNHIYNARETVFTQNHADFWQFGPAMPLPDAQVKRKVLKTIESLCSKLGSPFEVFNYPEYPISVPIWETGDHHASDFVIIRPYGIEFGMQNWRDGLVCLGFFSFEQILNRPNFEHFLITPDIKAGIHDYLSKN